MDHSQIQQLTSITENNSGLSDAGWINGIKADYLALKHDPNVDFDYAEGLIITKLQSVISIIPESNTAGFDCVPSNFLASRILSDFGIKHFIADLPGHVSLVVVNSSGRVFWRDFTPGGIVYNMEILPSDFEDTKTFEGIATGNDIVRNVEVQRNEKPEPENVTLYPPEIGTGIIYLHNVAYQLLLQKKFEEALMTYKTISNIDPLSTKHTKTIDLLERRIEYDKQEALNANNSIS